MALHMKSRCSQLFIRSTFLYSLIIKLHFDCFSFLLNVMSKPSFDASLSVSFNSGLAHSKLIQSVFLSSPDLGSALSGSNCGFKWSHVQRLCGAYTVSGAHPAPHCAPVSHRGSPVSGPLPGSSNHYCGTRVAG